MQLWAYAHYISRKKRLCRKITHAENRFGARARPDRSGHCGCHLFLLLYRADGTCYVNRRHEYNTGHERGEEASHSAVHRDYCARGDRRAAVILRSSRAEGAGARNGGVHFVARPFIIAGDHLLCLRSPKASREKGRDRVARRGLRPALVSLAAVAFIEIIPDAPPAPETEGGPVPGSHLGTYRINASGIPDTCFWGQRRLCYGSLRFPNGGRAWLSRSRECTSGETPSVSPAPLPHRPSANGPARRHILRRSTRGVP